MGFRPLAGIRVFRTQGLGPRGILAGQRFRPLAGIRVFRTVQEWYVWQEELEVSVPWRGLGSFGRKSDSVSSGMVRC